MKVKAPTREELEATADRPRPNAAALAAHARALYVGGPLLRRKFQHWRPLICPFDELLPYVPHDAAVLDVGCGAGLFLGLLARAGWRPRGIGFDASADAIVAAGRMGERVGATGADLRFQHLGVNEPWPAGPFDVVAAIDVMHHIPPAQWREVAARLAGHVAPGGVLIYKDMCRRPHWRAIANRLHDLLVAHEWIHYLPVEQMDRWAAEHGLQQEVARRLNRAWWGHELRVYRRPGDHDAHRN